MGRVSETYYRYLAEKELWLQYCDNCQQYVFYPRDVCSNCLEAHLRWQKTGGQGHIYSYTIIYVSALPEMSPDLPYIYALITLQEGVRMATRIIDCSIDQVEVGMPVQLAVRMLDGLPRAFFKPVSRE